MLTSGSTVIEEQGENDGAKRSFPGATECPRAMDAVISDATYGYCT